MPYARRPLPASLVQKFQARRGCGPTNQRGLDLVWELNEKARESIPRNSPQSF